MDSYLSTAEVKLCDAHIAHDNPTEFYDVHTEHCETAAACTRTEIDVLAQLGEDGYRYFPAFHGVDEVCAVRRPLSDFARVWHPDLVNGEVFCLHLHRRGRRIEEGEAGEEEAGDEEMGDEEMEDEDEEVLDEEVKDEDTESADGVQNAETAVKVDDESSELGFLERTPTPTDYHPARDTATFTLAFELPADAPVDFDLWHSRDLPVDLAERLDSLPSLVQETVESVAAQDLQLTEALLENKHRLFFKVETRFQDERDLYADFTYKVRVETVGDLF